MNTYRVYVRIERTVKAKDPNQAYKKAAFALRKNRLKKFRIIDVEQLHKTNKKSLKP